MTRKIARALMAVPLLFAVPQMAPAQEPAEAAWIATSNAYTQQVLEMQAQFSPEDIAQTGLEQFDGLAMDLGPDLAQRFIAAEQAKLDEFTAALARETDPQVKQDLQILIDSLQRDIEGTRLSERLALDWYDIPQAMFGNFNGALDDQVAPERQAKALELLQRYTGLYPGTTPLTELAKARWNDSQGDGKVGPYKGEVEDTLAKTDTYIAGIRALFAKQKITGAKRALDTMEQQLRDYAAWEKDQVLPRAREDFRLPPELYAFRLKSVGIDLPPEQLITLARRGFYDTRMQMEALAPLVAAKFGFPETDYPSVIRALKQDKIADAEIESYYAGILGQIDDIIAREHIISLPDYPVLMRVGSPAENASQPAPHMVAPRMVGNTGERGQFVLSTGDPSAGADAAYDDFNFKAAAWTLSAHEARPGHELQFAQMVERGVSQARALYAFNSVNAEGWGLFAEAELEPYEPIEGQLIALQMRLQREARAMLDPMLNLGMITPEEATALIREQVGLSKAMTKQEVDRYTFRMPGQAGSYYYGYSQLTDLRIATEVALGDKFDRQRFNDFVVGQGLLPLDLLAQAVMGEFVPEEKAR